MKKVKKVEEVPNFLDNVDFLEFRKNWKTLKNVDNLISLHSKSYPYNIKFNAIFHTFEFQKTLKSISPSSEISLHFKLLTF